MPIKIVTLILYLLNIYLLTIHTFISLNIYYSRSGLHLGRGNIFETQ